MKHYKKPLEIEEGLILPDTKSNIKFLRDLHLFLAKNQNYGRYMSHHNLYISIEDQILKKFNEEQNNKYYYLNQEELEELQILYKTYEKMDLIKTDKIFTK